MTDAFIYDAVRSPRGKGRADGALSEVTPVQLAAQMLQAVREIGRLAIAGAAVDVAAQNRATQTSILSEAFGIFCIGMGGSHSIGSNPI